MNKKSMYKQPFFSICIPVYNAELFLRDCIESVLEQSETDYEIVLVDDGSVDRSAAICDEYKAKYSNISVFHKENEGPLLARHDAVQLSRGQYLMFLDSDDLYTPDALHRIKEVIQNTNADMVVFDWNIFSDTGETEWITEPYINGTCFTGLTKKEFCAFFLKNARLNSMCRKCIHRDVYDINADYSQYKGLIQGEDKLVSIHCVDRAEKIVYLKKSLYKYRMNSQGTTHNITLKNYRDIQVVRQEIFKYLDLWKLPSSVNYELMMGRLLFACSCVISIACRIKCRKSTKWDLRTAICYISADEDFLEAYKLRKNSLSLYKKAVCRCIVKKQFRVLRILVLVSQLKNIRHRSR